MATNYLFIDTNIFLNLFHYSNDDLEELNKLAVLLRDKRLTLILPSQVAMEFRRNRESKIADSLKRLKEIRLALQFPQICKDYPEYRELRKHQREFEDAHKRLMARITSDAQSKSLRADYLIGSLFERAQIINSTPILIGKARERLDIGNPPGKKGSLGDAINWEALLGTVETGRDVYFISGDKDYCSDLDENKFDGFLLQEWADTKKANVHFFKSLSTFFDTHFPEIRLVVESEKDIAIRDLAQSGNFATTHSVISRLAQYADFTPAQLDAIVSAAINNSQVYWIIEDEDVSGFLKSILRGHEESIEPENLAQLKQLLSTSEARLDAEVESIASQWRTT